MADDSLIRATTSVDVSGLKTGMAEASTVTRAGLDDIKAQYAAAAVAVKAATANMAQAQASFGPAAKAGNETARAALAQYEAELATATVAQAELTAALETTTVAETQQAFATEVLATAHGAAVTQIQATSGALRVLEGTGGIRAAERLLTMIPGIGAALQVAFPVIGAIALIETFGRLWEKTDPLIKAEKELEETTKRLDKEYEQLGKRLERLQIAEITAEFGKAAGAKLAFFQAGTNIEEDKAHIQALSHEIDTLKGKLASGQNASMAPGFIGQILTQRSETAAIDKIRGLTDQMNYLQQKVVVDTREASKDLVDAAKDGAKEATAAARARVQALRETDAEALADIQADHQMTIGETINFWNTRLAQEQQFPQRVTEIKKAIGHLSQAQDREEAAAKKRTGELRLEIENELWVAELAAIDRHSRTVIQADRKAAEDEKRAYEQNRSITAANAAGGETTAIGGLDAQKLQIGRQQSLALSSTPQAEVQYLEQLKAIDAKILQEKYQTQIRMLQLDSLNSPVKAAEDMRKLDQVMAQGYQKIYQDQTQILVKQQAAYKTFFNTIRQDFTGAVTGWLTGQRTFASGMLRIWSDIESQVIGSILRIGIAWAAQAIKNTIVHATQTAAQVATTAAGAAASTGILKASALEQSLRDAKLAFKNTYAAVSAIPVIGPFLAPVAAAAAFTAVAAFETGTAYVPSTGVALIHKGERIIDAQSNQQITSALAGGGAGGGFTMGDIHVHMPNTGGPPNGRAIGKEIAKTLQHFIRTSGKQMA